MRTSRRITTIGAASAAPIVLSAVVLTLASPAPAQPQAPTKRAQLEQSFALAINRARVEHGLRTVQFDGRLREAARGHSADMIQRAYFAHRAYASRIAAAGAPGDWVGEALGWVASSTRPVDEVVELWLASPTHRAVLLSTAAARLGIGISFGPFRGEATAIVVTADFQGWSGR